MYRCVSMIQSVDAAIAQRPGLALDTRAYLGHSVGLFLVSKYEAKERRFGMTESILSRRKICCSSSR
jgi:hypothetical protein